MLQRDTDLLDGLLDDEYTLTHLIGYLQSKREWLEQIDSGEMEYCSSLERGTSVEVIGDTAALVGQQCRRHHDLGQPRHLELAAHHHL